MKFNFYVNAGCKGVFSFWKMNERYIWYVYFFWGKYHSLAFWGRGRISCVSLRAICNRKVQIKYVYMYIWQEFYSLGGIGLVNAADKCIISHSHGFGFVPLLDARWLEPLQASHTNATISSGKRATISSCLSIFNIEENLSQILPSSHKACSVNLTGQNSIVCPYLNQSMARGMRTPQLSKGIVIHSLWLALRPTLHTLHGWWKSAILARDWVCLREPWEIRWDRIGIDLGCQLGWIWQQLSQSKRVVRMSPHSLHRRWSESILIGALLCAK